MRLLYLTVSMPFGTREAFLIPEVREMMRRGWEILIVPRSPSRVQVNRDAELFRRISVAEPVFSLRILLAAVGILLRHPLRSAIALAALLRSGDVRNIFKNLVVYAKSLWLAGLAHDWRADHIHAHWLTTTATMAMIASEISGIPWSSTAHRGDIARHNLLPLKLSRARFVRFISEDGIPVVSTATGGIPELLRSGAGLMVPPQDPEALADALESIIVDPARRRQLGETARRRVEEEFAVKKSVAQLLSCIEPHGGADGEKISAGN